MSLQADGKVAFEDVPVFGVCRPACHDSSLFLVDKNNFNGVSELYMAGM